MEAFRQTRTLSLSICLAVLLPFAVSLADEIVLRSGDTFKGRVIEESEESIRFEIHISASIRETRTFPRGEVAEIHLQSPAERAFEELTAAADPSARATVEDYDRALGLAGQFLEQHADSPQAALARQLVNELTEERELVFSGAVRVGDVWFSQEEQTRNSYEFNSLVLATRMRDHVENERFLPALRDFDQLMREYPLSEKTVEVIPLAQQAVARLRTRIDRMILDNPARIESRDRAKQSLPIEQARRMEAAIEEEEKRFEALLKEEQEAGLRWRSYNALHLRSLEETRDLLEKTSVELQNQDLDSIRERSERFLRARALLREARDLMDEKRYTEALARIDAAEANDAPQDDVRSLREQIAEARALAETPAPPPVRPSTPATSTVDELDDLGTSRLGQVMRDQHADAERARAQAEADRVAAEEQALLAAEEAARAAAMEATRIEAEARHEDRTQPAVGGVEPPSSNGGQEGATDPSDETMPDSSSVVSSPDGAEDPPATPASPSGTPEAPDAGVSSESSGGPVTPSPSSGDLEAEQEGGFTSVLNMIIIGLAGLMVVLILVMKITDLGSARRENTRRERELAEREAAAKAEQEALEQEEAEMAAQGEAGSLSLDELEAQAELETDPEHAGETETHTARIPLVSAKVEPPVPRP